MADYGYFGKGDSGYAHYTQTFNSTFPNSGSSGSSHSSSGSSGRMPTRKEIEQMSPEERQKLNDNLDESLRKSGIYLAIAIVVLFFIFAK